MLKDLKRSFALSLAAALLLGGCASKSVHSPKIGIDRAYETYEEKPVETVFVREMVVKRDSLNHDGIGNFGVALNIRDGMPLGDLPGHIGLPIYVDDDVAGRIVPAGHYEGGAREILERIASLTGTYWSYDGYSIRFSRTKTVTYTFPALSPFKLASIYNIGNNKKDAYTVDKIKEDLFDELSATLASIFDTGKLKGTATHTYEAIKEHKTTDSKRNKVGNDKRMEILKHDESQKVNGESEQSQHYRSDSNKSEDREKKSTKKGVESEKKKNRGKSQKDDLFPKIRPVVENVTEGKNEKRVKSDDTAIKSNEHTHERQSVLAEATKNSDAVTRSDAKDLQKVDTQKTVRGVKSDLRIEYGKGTPFVVSKEAGIVTVVVTRDKEAMVDTAIRSIIQQALGSIVALDLYILEVSDRAIKNAELNLDVTGKMKRLEGALKTGTNSVTSITFDTLSNLNDLRRITATALVNYLTEKGEGKILQRSKLLMLPSIPSRIKATVDYPYLEPQQISVGGTDSQLSYEIKYVNDGLDVAVVTNTLGDSVVMSIGVSLNQYLGKETMQAGQLGTFDLPVQSPRTLDTTFRAKAGSVVLLGGMKKITLKETRQHNFLLPSKLDRELSKNNIVIVAYPRIIRFVEQGANMTSLNGGYFIGAMPKERR